jgi:hypothetical protein
MLASVDRLLVCLPERSSIVELLEESARIATVLAVPSIEIVAAPAHDLHASRRRLIPSIFGRRAGDIHLTWSAARTADLAAAVADHRSLIVARPREARRVSRRTRAAVLALTAPIRGDSVLTLVNPDRDTPAVVMAALVMAACLELRRVVVCYPWYDEAAMTTDDNETRAIAERREALAIFLARVPATDIVVEPRVVFSPVRWRTASRMADEEQAAIVVGTDWLGVNRPLLALPPAVACRQRPSMLAALWASFVDGPLRA